MDIIRSAPWAHIIAAIIGYAAGSVLMACIIAKRKGGDIGAQGNGNPGASNTAMAYGIGAGPARAAWDIVKPMLAFFICAVILRLPDNASMLAAYMAVIGHVFPAWRKLKGGKGFAPYIGAMFCVQPMLFLFTAAIAAVAAAVADFITAATFVTIAICPLWAWFIDVSYGIPATLLSLLLLWRHRENIRKIRAGTEPRLTSVLGKYKDRFGRIAGAIKDDGEE